MMKKRIISAALCLALAASAAGCGNNKKQEKEEITGAYSASTDLTNGFLKTAAVDDYGRAFAQVDGYNENVVGIFYFLWLGLANQRSTKSVDAYEKENKVENTLTGEDVGYAPDFTYWGEPMYGYYQPTDEWVVRRHVEMFINAGLDFICFDCTNNDFYQRAAKTVLDVLLEYKQLGYNVPKAMFMTNTASTQQAESIYNAFYRRNTYDEIWFTGNGNKPWMIADYAGDNETIKNRLYFKAAQWPNRTYDSNRFPWISWRYPQETFTDDTQGYDIMSVSTSQHTGIGGSYADDAKYSGANFSLSGLLAPYNYDSLSDKVKNIFPKDKATDIYNSNHGRGWSNATKTNNYENAVKNTNFEEQWETVYKTKDVNLVFITGWNEWIAQKQSTDPMLGREYGYFVDTFNMEFSRDIEPMSGGYLDNCFIQMVKNIRKFKNNGGSKTFVGKTDKDMLELSNWIDVPSYADLVGETAPRKASSVGGGTTYTDNTGRNDIREVRIAADSDNVYVLVATQDNITEKQADDTRWMNVWIGVDGETGGWNNLQYVVNRSLNGKKSSLNKIENNSYTNVGEALTVVKDNVMIVKIKKSALGISGDSFGLQIKISDNLQKDFDITDLYKSGDVAPIGRINYSWYTK